MRPSWLRSRRGWVRQRDPSDRISLGVLLRAFVPAPPCPAGRAKVGSKSDENQPVGTLGCSPNSLVRLCPTNSFSVTPGEIWTRISGASMTSSLLRSLSVPISGTKRAFAMHGTSRGGSGGRKSLGQRSAGLRYFSSFVRRPRFTASGAGRSGQASAGAASTTKPF